MLGSTPLPKGPIMYIETAEIKAQGKKLRRDQRFYMPRAAAHILVAVVDTDTVQQQKCHYFSFINYRYPVTDHFHFA